MKTLVFTRLRFGVAQRREKSTKYFSRKQAEKSTLGGRYPAAGIILQVIISGKEDFFYEIVFEKLRLDNT